MKASQLKLGGLFLLCASLASCHWNSRKVGELPVVKINNEQMSLKEFSDELSKHLKSFDAIVAKNPGQVQRVRDIVIRDFLMQKLLERYAKEKKISVSQKEWDDEIAAIRASYPDDLAFRKVLVDENLSLNEWKQSVRASVLQKKVFQLFRDKIAKPTEDEIKKHYDEHKDHFKHPERIWLRQIVVDDYGKALDIKEAVRKKDFGDLAKKFSVAPEGKTGGVVGWVDKGSVDIFDKAFSQSTGSVSPVLESPYGFHLFKVDKKEGSGLRRIEEVRSLIEQLLVSQREQKEYTQWLDQQIRSSHVMVDYDLIKQLKIETRTQE